MGWNNVEYPLWPLLGDGGARVRIEHVEVRSASARARAGAPFAPCLVVAIGEGQRVRVEVREWARRRRLTGGPGLPTLGGTMQARAAGQTGFFGYYFSPVPPGGPVP